jgi:thiosulfate/3-mercaptopyruvate sulfurtransferase
MVQQPATWSFAMPSPLIETQDLASRLHEPSLKLVEVSYAPVGQVRDSWGAFCTRHIPGAVYFDLEKHCDHSTGLPHTLLGPDAFQAVARALGINNGDTIVVYDSAGLFSAARVWWNFRVMGAQDVLVLNGGSKRWQAENRPIQQGSNQPAPGDFTARFHPELVRNLTQMLDLIENKQAAIIDARSAGRFEGRDAEPRAGLACGHIPGSFNVPFGQLLNPDGTFKALSQISQVFIQTGVPLDKDLVTTCGSGVTAAILALGLAVLGHSDVAVYDGSWSEWGASSLTTGLIATGPA